MSSPSLQRDQNRPSKARRASATPRTGSLNSLDALIAEIARLQEQVIEELRQRRVWLHRELAQVDAELADLTWEPGTGAAAASAVKKTPTLSELIEALQAAPGRTLNIRKANLEVKSIKTFAKAHPHLLRLGGKTGWPTVTLLERSTEAPMRMESPRAHPDLFSE